MQLKIQRSQRAGGIVGQTVFFALDVRADYSPAERENIRRYRLDNQVIYSSRRSRQHVENANAQLDRTSHGSNANRATGLARGLYSMAMAKMSLNISIASLGRGHHIECKDLEEMLEAEDTVRSACKNVTQWLDIASTFDGSEVVIEYDKGEERVHIMPHAPPLLLEAPSQDEPQQLLEHNASPDTSPQDPEFPIVTLYHAFRDALTPAESGIVLVLLGMLALLILYNIL